ncbi:anhydro-N-acetylmuramic acid kinase [Fastidiosibacter lacustris]|uniref:anhydro-N-acetylmuramic acid kinase n=1 Tax=Fastidiosibacter lacustris TaxID=2056695 RepID=UPI000E34F4E2|nr:anhydro-N-acetylmuramic acid kinase [Fastidiosibacter lacustris]
MLAYYVGVMSGTSMDAIDCVVVQFESSVFKLIAAHSFSYPSEIKSAIRQIYQNNYHLSLHEFGSLDYELGLIYANCINELLNRYKIEKAQIKAVGCHGQTVYHHPHKVPRFSIQLGNGNVIAAKTNLVIVNDFRNKDMIFGGQGAPLVPVFHQTFFSHSMINRVILNLGGIANISCLHSQKTLIGFDTGPANTLIDHWIYQHKGKAYDHNGEWGKGGQVLSDLLNRMLADPYFSKQTPKSTGLEYFNLSWLKQYLTGNEEAQDVQATLHVLSAKTIADAVLNVQPDTKEVYVCGGGVGNDYLMELLKECLPEISLTDISSLGVDGQWIEAIAFAWFGYCHINSKKIPFSLSTGGSEDCLVGTLHRVK